MKNFIRIGSKHSRSELPRIGVDLLGSDTSPSSLIEAVFEAEKEMKGQASFVVFATQDVFEAFPLPPSIQCISVTEIVSPEDDPLLAARRKKHSSLYIGMNMLQKKEIDAFITAGNTGALFALAKLFLTKLPGIARPALLALLPTKRKEVAVLDVGANVSVKVQHLIQFASMGIAFQKTRGIATPTVGLLNIGAEAKKGTPELRETYQKLQLLNQKTNQNSPIFIGNVEGRDVFQGHIDVLVTDGFTGNIFLKTSEGIATFLLEELQANVIKGCSSEVQETINEFKKRLLYAEYPGAILCGIDGIVVKCHGNATSRSLFRGITGALNLLQHQFLDQIKKQLTFDSQKVKTNLLLRTR